MRKFAIFLVAAVVSPTLTLPSVAFAQQTFKDRLVGTWKVVSWESVRPSGQVVNVWMGRHPTGLIMYRSNGYMGSVYG
jgi:Lipocalin-like domain